MSLFFLRYSTFISRSRQPLLPPWLSSARQRKLIWPHESPVQPYHPPLSSPSSSRGPNCYVGTRFDLSRRCRQPLINVQEQLYCYIHRSSWRNARDSEESRWLFLSVLEQPSGKIPEDSRFLCDNIERTFDRGLFQIRYISLRTIIHKIIAIKYKLFL